jgi:hypothetical protein
MRTGSGFRWGLALCLSAVYGIALGCGSGSSTSSTTSGGTASKAPDFGFKYTTHNAEYVIAPGGKMSFPLTLSSVNGFPSQVTLSATAPTGWTVTFVPNNMTLPVGDTAVTMTVTASPTATPASTQNVLYKAVGGGLTRYDYGPGMFDSAFSNREFTVTGVSFTVPTAITLASATGSFTSTRDVNTGTQATVNYVGNGGTFTPKINGLPTGVTAVFDSPTIILGDSASVDFTVTTTGSPTPGTYPLTVSFVEGATTHTSSPINLVISANPAASNHLLVSGNTANTTVLKNGAYGEPVRGQTYSQNVTVGGVQYNGEYFFSLGLTASSEFSVFLYGLPVSNGHVYDFATTTNQFVQYTEGKLEYYAATGTLTVNSITSTAITLTFANVTFQAIDTVNGKPTGATGTFTLNGTITYPLNQH